MERVTPVILAVGTTHPLNIAGVGLDLRIAPLLHVRVVLVVAGISAQNARTVLAREAVGASTIAAQFAALDKVPVGAIHVGALLDPHSVRAVAAALTSFRAPVVCDPVIAVSGGDPLADDATVGALRDELFPLCTLLTPNLAEAARLVGYDVCDIETMEAAGRALRVSGPRAVLVKGGHLSGAATDVLVAADGVTRFTSPRIDASLRGTGDLLACAIAAELAAGGQLVPSIAAARTFVQAQLLTGVDFAGTRTLPV